MFLTFLKIGYRNLLQNWTMSLISVIGLALGLTATLLITLYVAHEYSYDRFHQRGDRIVKVSLSHTDGESSYTIPWMSFSFGEALKNACPEVADFARIRNESSGGKLVQSDNQHKFFESNFRFADAGFVRMFDFPFIQGNPTTALTRPATVLLTERTARKYFGNASPLGKTIKFDKKYTFEVVGVLRDLPTNSSLQFDFLAHIDASRAIDHANYSSFLSEKETKAQMNIVGASGTYHTYLLLHPGASVDKVAAKIPTILTPKERLKDSKDAFQLHPLFDLHLTVDALGVRSRTLLFSGIAFFVLILALVNYVNLSTARSTKRAKEVAVRKVAGAPRQLLIAQFYIESALQVTLAFGLSMLLFSSLQPHFSRIVHFQTDPSFLLSRFFVVPAGLFFIGCIFLAGSYPALLLSGFSPVANLKAHSASSRTLLIRSGLTVFQFVVSIALIISSILMSKQFDLFLRKDVGIDREQVLTIPLNHEPEMAEHYATIREKVSQIPGVERVTASSLVMYGNYMNGWGVKRLDLDNPKQVSVSAFNVDQQFIKTMNIGWAIPPAGNASFRSKSQIVLNETAARMLGITKANYRQTLDLNGVQKELAGVVKDFNYTSLESSIKPMLFFIAPDTTRHEYLYVKLAKSRANDMAATEATLMRIQQVYDQYKTEYPFEYTFLDDTYQKLYQTYLINGQIVYFFTCLAILIACLGLFGLAAFTAEQRTKEIGVRKVLGASVTSIVALLSRDFLKLVLIAIVIASPIAYYAMHQWLHDFAYKITIEWWVFALAGLLAIGIALLTVSFQSVKAALINPIKSLRNE